MFYTLSSLQSFLIPNPQWGGAKWASASRQFPAFMISFPQSFRLFRLFPAVVFLLFPLISWVSPPRFPVKQKLFRKNFFLTSSVVAENKHLLVISPSFFSNTTPCFPLFLLWQICWWLFTFFFGIINLRNRDGSGVRFGEQTLFMIEGQEVSTWRLWCWFSDESLRSRLLSGRFFWSEPLKQMGRCHKG